MRLRPSGLQRPEGAVQLLEPARVRHHGHEQEQLVLHGTDLRRGLRGVLLGELDLSKLKVGVRVFGIDLQGLLEVGSGFFGQLLVQLGHSAPDVGGGVLGGEGDRSVGGLSKEVVVLTGDGDLGEAILSFDVSRIQARGVAEALLGE